MMVLIQIGWLVLMAIGMTAWVLNDARQYRLFKSAEDSATRQLFYWRWVIQSFVVLVGASLISLCLAGDLRAPFDFPALFEPARAALKRGEGAREMSGSASVGFAIGAALSIGAALFVQYRRVRRTLLPVVGDIEPLLPRNLRETLIAVPLSINAGVSEELFFRCALPLLLAQVTGSVAAASAVSIVAFGLAHAYQGWKGVAATMAVGALLMMFYLSSGSLLRVMAIHALIDIVALVVRPTLTRWMAGRQVTAVAI